MTADIEKALQDHDLILAEAAVIESLRRSAVGLHPRLENALLVSSQTGRQALSSIYRDYISVAKAMEVPNMVCSPTWRANEARVLEAGISRDVNGDAVHFMKQLRSQYGSWAGNIFIGGLIGCRNDCYRPDESLSTAAAEAFHAWQVKRLAAAGVDLLIAQTLPAVAEAAGIALALSETRIPYVISFVIGRNGRILDGSSLQQAFGGIDAACSHRPPLGYMINCAHPSFLQPGRQPKSVMARLIGFLANASSMDHSQLDGAASLQVDDRIQWAEQMVVFNRRFGVKILGGCCGTGRSHLEHIASRIGGDGKAWPA